jgi:hypothetical protein
MSDTETKSRFILAERGGRLKLDQDTASNATRRSYVV